MGRLIRDVIRRQWVLLPGLGAFAFVNGAVSSALPPTPLTLVVARGWSTVIPMVIGIALAANVNAPVIRTLPLSRQTLWRCGYLLATVVPVLFLWVPAICGGLIGASSHAVQLPGMALVAGPLDVVYVGALVGLWSLFPVPMWDIRWRPVSMFLNGLLLTALLCGSFGRYVLAPYLPKNWAELHGPRLSWLLGGVALAIVGWVRVPRAGRVMPATRRREAHTTLTATQPTRAPLTRLPDGVAGLIVRFVAIAVISAAAFVTFDRLVLSRFWSAGSAFELPWMAALVAYGTAVEIATTRTTRSLRVLRSLPVSSTTLTAIAVGLPAIFGLTWWAGVSSTYVVAHVPLPTLLWLRMLLVLLGVDALTRSVSLISGWSTVGTPAVLGFTAGIAPALVWLSTRPAAHVHFANGIVILNASGVVMLSGATALTHRALCRTRAVYAERPPKRAPASR